MQTFTDQRDAAAPDQLWLLQHPAIFTQGLAGKPEHVLDAGNIPIVKTDRGGQVTYHGPGQLIAYPLLNLKRLNIGPKKLVCQLETCVIKWLKKYDIHAKGDDDALGVYVDGAKICSIGLRIRKGCSYHGIALNINMDLSPFSRINPCGYQGLAITQTSQLGGTHDVNQAIDEFTDIFCQEFGYAQ
jgi:lipoyl(octanoyl) transferase